LTKNEYEGILKYFNIDENQIFTQENHYFDTPDFALKSKGAALRIRQKSGNFEMTLKQPAVVGLLETNQIISEEEAIMAIHNNSLPTGTIQHLIEKYEISFSNIEYFGVLVTERVEFEYQKGLLVLDHSIYLSKEDYELEYEVENYHTGEKFFLALLNQLKIPTRETDNKIRRFYNRKFEQTSQN
ncbi:MAG: CYTH domain-containing protein, partial [Bacillus sp. (in: firmicutes)]